MRSGKQKSTSKRGMDSLQASRVTICLLVYLSTFAYLAECSIYGTEITYASLNGDIVIMTGDDNYAIHSKKLVDAKDWQTVTINDNSVNIVGSDCSLNDNDIVSLPQSDKLLISSIRDSIILNPASSKFSTYNSNTLGNSHSSSSSSSGTPIVNTADRFMISGSNLPNNWYSVIVDQGIAAFINHDNSIAMGPLKCMTESERQTLDKIREQTEIETQRQTSYIMDSIQGTFNQVQDMMRSSFSGFPFTGMFSNVGWPFNGPSPVANLGGGGAQAFAYAG